MWACLAWLAWRRASHAPTGAWQGKARRKRVQQTVARSLRRRARTEDLSAKLHASHMYLKLCLPPALQAASAHLQQHIAGYTPQGVSNFIWACSVLGFYSQELYEAVASDVLSAPHVHSR